MYEETGLCTLVLTDDTVLNHTIGSVVPELISNDCWDRKLPPDYKPYSYYLFINEVNIHCMIDIYSA